MTAEVKYCIATYQGVIKVNCNQNDNDEFIIAKAKKILTEKAGGSLPYGYEKWKVVNRYC
jgi:hypothetical protein